MHLKQISVWDTTRFFKFYYLFNFNVTPRDLASLIDCGIDSRSSNLKTLFHYRTILSILDDIIIELGSILT